MLHNRSFDSTYLSQTVIESSGCYCLGCRRRCHVRGRLQHRLVVRHGRGDSVNHGLGLSIFNQSNVCSRLQFTYVVNCLRLHPGRDVSRRYHDSACRCHCNHVSHCLCHGSRLDGGHDVRDRCSLSVHQSLGLLQTCQLKD